MAVRNAFDPPPREQTKAVPVPALAGLSAAALASATLEAPSGSEYWRLAADGEPDRNSASAGDSFRITATNADGTQQTAAVLRREEQASREEEAGAVWNWEWTPEASEILRADELRNCRLRVDGRTIYLRTPTPAGGVRLRFDAPQQSEQWSLATAAAPRRSHLTLSATILPAAAGDEASESAERGGAGRGEEPRAGDEAIAEPLRLTWLQPVENATDRSVRGLVEIREREASPVAVRVRLDIQAGRDIHLETLAVATVEPSSEWQPADRLGIAEAQDQLNAQQAEVEQLLQVIEQQYPRLEDRDARAAMRARREALEEQQKRLADWAARLADLQVLLSRIAAEIQWDLALQTEWPDATQTIFRSQ